jgi:hypothetical protein
MRLDGPTNVPFSLLVMMTMCDDGDDDEIAHLVTAGSI